MATDRRPTDPATGPTTGARPTEAESEGMDSYPTYRDGPVPPHVATGAKPTDTALPRSRRTYGTPMLIGLVAFALLILVVVFGGFFQTAEEADEAFTPGDPASAPASTEPAATDPAATEPPEASADPAAEDPGTLDDDVEIQTETGPDMAPATPGEVDVPGGG